MTSSIANPSVLFPFLEEIGASPQKSLSQNFLIDANIVRKIADSAEISEGDIVLEIGPGPGALTQEFLRRGAQVIAIEKDKAFATNLLRLQTNQLLHVYEADFLKFPLIEILQNKPKVKVVANLPYHITTPILEKLCQHRDLISMAFVMMQREVADRLLAKPKTKEYGAFTLFLATYATVKIALQASKNCFYPAPKVDSSVVHISFHQPILEDTLGFHNFVRKAFQQRRKMLRSTLSIHGAFATKRPEDLSLEEWLLLYTEQNIVLAKTKNMKNGIFT